jgi:hypothetical protein
MTEESITPGEATASPDYTAGDRNQPTFALAEETTKARLLLDALKSAGHLDDDDLILDMIEGETDALEAVSKVIRWMNEQAAMAVAVKAQVDDLSARAKRYTERTNSARLALFRFMDLTGQKTLVRPEATLSIRAGKVGVELMPTLDVDKLPDEFVTITRAPNKTAIKEALDANREVDGAKLTNGAPSLNVRVR